MNGPSWLFTMRHSRHILDGLRELQMRPVLPVAAQKGWAVVISRGPDHAALPGRLQSGTRQCRPRYEIGLGRSKERATEWRKLAAQYRALAEELRTLLPQIKMPENRIELLALAEKYEKLAERLERA